MGRGTTTPGRTPERRADGRADASGGPSAGWAVSTGDLAGAGGARARTPALAGLVAACLALAALSLLLPSTPTYDPWAWIVWGREVLDLDLSTVDGPSWKPLPVLFTTAFAAAGDAAPALWLVVARAGALLGVAMAYRLGSRLAGPLAGVVGALGVALSAGWLRNAALGNSEGLLVGLGMLAVERHLDGRRDHALVLATGAALLRPETWPFLGLYAGWLWLAEPRRRRLIVAALALVPLLWLGPELWGSGDALRASDRAQQPNPGSPAFAENPAVAVIENAYDMLSRAAVAGVAILLVLVLARRAPKGTG
ncbi:MAG: hypothetical protein M3N16_09235, partial [Actinomycetota bacterium]|nr:hypothetical protein [Actinomycetota bacterium]